MSFLDTCVVLCHIDMTHHIWIVYLPPIVNHSNGLDYLAVYNSITVILRDNKRPEEIRRSRKT